MFDIHKNYKLLYYFSNLAALLVPKAFFRARLNSKLSLIKNYDISYIRFRLNYYNKLSGNNSTGEKAVQLSELRIGSKRTTYFFDSYAYARYFDQHLKANFLFGDNTQIPGEPTILKSRPVITGNENAVLLNLNKIRHFVFVTDTRKFESKKDMMVWRGRVYQPHRIRFMELYHNHPLCDIGQVNTHRNPPWVVKRLTIGEQLDYKFILCIEGNDVASNLKWVMSSNSVAVMPKPRYETWFMEGTLIPDVHYIVIKDDYSDLEERLHYFISNPEKAVRIAEEANRYVNQFKNKEQEELLSLLVLQKYFHATGQIDGCDSSLYTT